MIRTPKQTLNRAKTVNDRLPLTMLTLGLVVAMLIWLTPVRSGLAFWRPPFVLLFVIYWLFHQPQFFGTAFAWLVGFAIDILFGTILGQHALAMSVAAYLVISQQHRTHHFRILFQAVFVAVIVLAYELILLSVRLLVDDVEVARPLIFPALSSALLWPLLCATLEQFHRARW